MAIKRVWFIFVLLSFLSSITSSSAEPVSVKAGGLYADNPDVINLNSSSYDSVVVGSEHAWYMQFYNSWCGHCVNFAPLYRQAAQDIKGWKEYLSVGAVDCAQEVNAELCRDFGLSLFPTLTFIPANTVARANGTLHKQWSKVELFRQAAILFISASSRSQIAAEKLHVLRPIARVEVIFQYVKDDSEIPVLVGEAVDSYVGREVILDMLPNKKLIIRRMLLHTLRQYNQTLNPALFLVQRRASRVLKKLSDAGSREAYVKELSALQGLSEGVAPEFGVTRNELSSSVDSSSRSYDHRVYVEDIESCLHYSLRHEVAMHQAMSISAVTALRRYVKTLSIYLPVKKSVSDYLHAISVWLETDPATRGSITGEAWLTGINQLQTRERGLEEVVRWRGCVGSQAVYRGYPCGLWTLFHTLTVAAHTDSQSSTDAQTVLTSIRGYIQYFFSCRDCRQHFLRETSNMISEVGASSSAAILYLWTIHNRVNLRLAGDASEDPRHPKRQFPTVSECPTCHVVSPFNGSDAWRTSQVLEFLVNMYSSDGIVRGGEELALPVGGQSNDSFVLGDAGSFFNINGFDFFLCFSFYMLCTGVIVLGYYHLTRHRRRVSICCQLKV